MKDELKFLLIDTSIENITNILLVLGDKVSNVTYDESRAHLKNLIPGIKEILQKNNLEISDLNFVAINEGPGSWTGLRIGFATIKVFSLLNKIPLITFSSFDLIFVKNKIHDGIMLIKSSDTNFYYCTVEKQEIIKKGIISGFELLNKYPSEEKYYLEEDEKLLISLVIKKFNDGDFANIYDVEPDYITEGLITSKFEK
jgi:tRNA threonylcarbamoyl adenosine modification protein YeaZ